MFFDNLQLTHVQGHLQQEDTYYPYGMGIAALSSKAANGLQNGYKYNGISEEDNFDLDLYEAYYRTLDPQLGRWWQMDPVAGNYPGVTGYNFAFDNPVNFADPWGDDPGKWLLKLLNGTFDGGGLPGVTIIASNPHGGELLRRFVTDDMLPHAEIALRMQAGYELAHLKGRVSFGLPGWSPPPTAFITPYYPDLMDRWSESSGLARGTYETVDNTWVNIQSLFLQHFKQYVQHLNGEVANNNERVNAFVGTTTDVVTTIEGGKALSEFLGPVISKLIPKRIAPVFRAFTRKNFRYNLGELTGEMPIDAQAHHVFPVEFADRFAAKGINIHEPRYGVWWQTGSHLSNAKAYNQVWRDFLRTNPSQAQILDKGRQLMQQYVIPVNY